MKRIFMLFEYLVTLSIAGCIFYCANPDFKSNLKEVIRINICKQNGKAKYDFNKRMVVLKLDITLPDSFEGFIKELGIYGLHNISDYSLTGTEYLFKDENMGEVLVSNNPVGFITKNNRFSVSVSLFPESVEDNQMFIIAKSDNNKEYYYSFSRALDLKHNIGSVISYPIFMKEKTLSYKPAYTVNDFYQWDAKDCVLGENSNACSNLPANNSCVNSPWPTSLKQYLTAGVFWDSGLDNSDGNIQSYTVNGVTYHAGLWMKKMECIESNNKDFSDKTSDILMDANGKSVNDEGFGIGTTTLTVGCVVETKMGRPSLKEIDNYFFLPAVGDYSFSQRKIVEMGNYGGYWTCWKYPTNSNKSLVGQLNFWKGTAQLLFDSNNYGCLTEFYD